MVAPLKSLELTAAQTIRSFRDRSFFMREGGLVGFGGGHSKKIGLKGGGQPKKMKERGGGVGRKN